MTYHVGQKVVCVDDKWPTNYGYGDEVLPHAGEIYTISELTIDPGLKIPCCRLVELRNNARIYTFMTCGKICEQLWEPSFRLTRFRPLVERKTDISIFTKLLVDARITEKVGT